MKSRQWFWLLLAIPVALGVWRLRFDVDVLSLLPGDLPVVQGLKLYQQNFSSARELLVVLHAPDANTAETSARSLAEKLRTEPRLAHSVNWQSPWLEHPGQASELVAYLWFNQPPEVFQQLAERLAPTNLDSILLNTRDRLMTTMSPDEIARLGYDPYGLLDLPEDTVKSAPAFSQNGAPFASPDGLTRIIFVQSANELPNFKAASAWLKRVQNLVRDWRTNNKISDSIQINFTGGPAFMTEISQSMKSNIQASVIGTMLVIAALFWWAHRRWLPMLWLLTLLALVLGATMALGGLIFGAINVVSMGFAAMLLGLGVDYGLVMYQEARSSPGESAKQIRRGLGWGICWSAITTAGAFALLTFGGLPGLGQLGWLVAIGVILAAMVMLFAYLPPLLGRKNPTTKVSSPSSHDRNRSSAAVAEPSAIPIVATILLALGIAFVLWRGFPHLDHSTAALRPRNIQAYDTLDQIKSIIGQNDNACWLIVSGDSEREVAQRLVETQSTLQNAVSNQNIAGFNLPITLWPRPDFQETNRLIARKLVDRRPVLTNALLSNGFTSNALALTENFLATWQRAANVTGVFQPTNAASEWITQKVMAQTTNQFFTLGLVSPMTNSTPHLNAELPPGVFLSGWSLLGSEILGVVKHDFIRVLMPMAALLLISLWLAFKRLREVILSLGTLAFSIAALLAIMRLAGWSWNLMNMTALPLLFGSGIDYGIHIQLALRRHGGNLPATHRTVGRALLLCAGTTIAGFGSLAWSTNTGLASLGKICATGIACSYLASVFLLPFWWKLLAGRNVIEAGDQEIPSATRDSRPSTPSALYSVQFWKLGLRLARLLPVGVSYWLADGAGEIYWLLVKSRREVVIQNLLPVLKNDRAAARRQAKQLFRNFTRKLVDLWRYEDGMPIDKLLGKSFGWENFEAAQAQKRGVVLLTLHLGNWEFGAPWLAQRGTQLHVVTLTEPSAAFTELRKAARARWNVETLVVGDDPFAFVEIIRRLEAGATVALLVDRPTKNSSVEVELFHQPFAASVAAAELARASGCAILPVFLPRENGSYTGHILPQIAYDRAALRDREARRKLVQEIMRAFEPAIRQHPDQWYHFVPVWPE